MVEVIDKDTKTEKKKRTLKQRIIPDVQKDK